MLSSVLSHFNSQPNNCQIATAKADILQLGVEWVDADLRSPINLQVAGRSRAKEIQRSVGAIRPADRRHFPTYPFGSARNPMNSVLDHPSTHDISNSFVRRNDVGPESQDRWHSAWVLSMIVHTGILVILGLALRPETRGLSLENESLRSAGIVVAKRSEPTQFFDESKAATPSETDKTLPLEEAIPPTEPTSSLPEQAAAGLTSDLPLPGALSTADLTATISSPPLGFKLGAEAEAALVDKDRRAIASRNRNRQGPAAQLSLFGSAEVIGHRFVFVIDRSKSMGGDGLGALTASRHELSRQLQQLKENHEFQIIAYHHRTTMMGQRKMHPATAEYIERIPEFFSTLGAFGSTDHEMALQTALALDPDAIFFLTDGDQPELTSRQIGELQRRTRNAVTIHCIRFGFGKERESNHFMKQLARRTGGDYRYVDMNVK